MKIAVLSDIHGNYPALQAVLDDIRPFDVDELVWIGDYTDKGPFPEETLALIQTQGGKMIHGNTDHQVLSYLESQPSPFSSDPRYATICWAFRHLRPEAFGFLADMPSRLVIQYPGTMPIRVIHRSPIGNGTGPLPMPCTSRMHGIFREIHESVLICGHTHQRWIWEEASLLACNPGSIGMPCHGDPHASYAVLRWTGQRWQAELRKVPYNTDAVLEAYDAVDYINATGGLGKACVLTVQIGMDVFVDLVTHARRLAIDSGTSEKQAFSQAIWQEADATYPWERVAQGTLIYE